MPQIEDNASLPVEALLIRNQILGIIKGEAVCDKEDVLETV
jgi:hypothetical protein